ANQAVHWFPPAPTAAATGQPEPTGNADVCSATGFASSPAAQVGPRCLPSSRIWSAARSYAHESSLQDIRMNTKDVLEYLQNLQNRIVDAVQMVDGKHFLHDSWQRPE